MGKVNTVKASTLFVGIFVSLTTLSGLVLSTPASRADSSGSVTLSVDVPANCSLTVYPDHHSVTIEHNHTGTIGTSNIKSICNDPSGLAVYAVGYTNNTYGNTNLTATVGANTYNIASHATPSGTPAQSEWNMTLSPVSGDYVPTIVTGFDSAHAVPDVYTKIAYRNTMTDIGENATGAQFTATFNAYIDGSQATGSYTGLVKFLLVHPNVLTYNDQTGQPDTVQPATSTCEPGTPLLQNVASWGSSVALGETIEVVDARDCQTYKVKRLKMNAAGTETALWMSNLNLGAETLTVTQLDNTNTHLAPGVSAIPATTINTWIKSSGSVSYINPELIPIPGQDTYGNKYGTLYNYAAASASTYVYAQEAGTGNATSDLCPAGWRMPTGGSSGEFRALIEAYGLSDGNYGYSDTASFTSIQQDLGFSLSGTFTNSEPSSNHSSGRYWASTFFDSSDMDILTFNSSKLYPTSGSYRNTGYSVRCITE